MARRGRCSCRPRKIDEARALLEREYREWYERDELWSAELLWRSHGSSCAAGVGSSRPSTPPAPARSRSSTGSKGRRTTSRSPGRRPPGPAGVRTRACRSGLCGSARSSSGLSRPSIWRSSGCIALWSGDPSAGGGMARQGRAARPPSSGGVSPMQPWWSARLRRGAARARSDRRGTCGVVDVWEADATRLGRKWVLAQVTRCRGLVAAAQGAVEQPRRSSSEAVAQHETGRRSRSAGAGVARARRRPQARRQKRAARDAIGAALGGFEQLGAASWVEKARSELGRIGGRTRERGADARRAPRRRPGRRGSDEPRGRRRALPRRADGRGAPDPRLRQARRALAHRARADASGPRRARFRGSRDFKLSRARLASSGCRATSSRRSSHAAPQVSGGA